MLRLFFVAVVLFNIGYVVETIVLDTNNVAYTIVLQGIDYIAAAIAIVSLISSI